MQHYKGSLLGHSDSNSAEDTKLTVSFVGNYWKNIGSRTPSIRFGKSHIWNNYLCVALSGIMSLAQLTNVHSNSEANEDGINTRVGAQVLVENNVWASSKNTIYSTSSGYAVARGNDCELKLTGSLVANDLTGFS